MLLIQQFRQQDWRRSLLALTVSLLGGVLCAWAHTPLPWMIGPLVAMALCNFNGARLSAPPLGRELGQMFIAVTLGLYFTPSVAREVAAHAGVLVTAAISSILIGAVAAHFLSRVARVDDATAFFASVPGGAAEMATLGERFGASIDKVAVAHAVRIFLVVCTIPVVLTVANVHGGDAYRPVPTPFSAFNLLILFAIAAAGGLLFRIIRFPNPWMMGPLATTIVVTAAGLQLSSMLGILTNIGQVLLGCALGTRFAPTFLKGAPRFMGALMASIYLMMAMSALLAWALAALSGLYVPGMILATAPGGIAEMSITARTLQLGVALVTAAHVTRVLLILSFTLPIYRQLHRWQQSRAARHA
ncbi:MAG TPA: AbrB family transcriptional regulator [Usitatibacteraceae bacterium]